MTGNSDRGVWRAVDDRVVDGHTYLTQHKDDLYPVPAYRLCGEWRRETEGPEDVAFIGGRHGKLYRAPTHYRRLPEPPE